MATILLTSENYAFGPTAKLLSIAKELKKNNYLIYVGFGTAFQLAKMFPFDEIYDIDGRSDCFESDIQILAERCDLLVTAMDRPSLKYMKKIGKPVIWIDSLFWFWDNIPDYLWDVDLYIYQKSINDKKNLERYKDKINNLLDVGPIIENSYKKSLKKKQLLVAYGGMEAQGWYKIGVDSFYPYTFTRLLHNIDLSEFDRVLFTGNEDIVQDLKNKFQKSNFCFECLSHENFVDELRDSELIIMSPGLETPLESFYFDVPTIFLPPSNSSQYIILNEFRNKNIAPASIHFSDYLPMLVLDDKSIRESMDLFLLQLKEIESSQDILQKIQIQLDQLIKNRGNWRKGQSKYSKLFIKNLGGNGTEKAVEEINKFILKLGAPN